MQIPTLLQSGCAAPITVSRNQWNKFRGNSMWDGPRKCNSEASLLAHDELLTNTVKHQEYLDVFILKNFFEELKKTGQADLQTFVNTHRNGSSLPSYSIIGILIQSINRHLDRSAIINDLIDMTVDAGSTIKVLQNIVKYLCRNQSIKEIYKDTMRTWVRLPSTHYTTWSDEAIDKTIDHICQHSDWQYGASFLTNKNFHWLPTNLTTVKALASARNIKDMMNEPNGFCNDAVYYLNNLRSIELSYTPIWKIACSNISGLDTVEALVCQGCSNYGWSFTATDLPALKFLNWAENHIGHLIREGKLFAGFSKLEVLYLQYQKDRIHYFMNNDTFSDLQNLRILNLAGNEIEVWNISLRTHTHIELLVLRENRIMHIAPEFQSDFDQVYINSKEAFRVYLAGNLINCSCSQNNIKFVQWLINAKVIFDRNKLTCGMGDGRPLGSMLKDCAQQQSVEWSTSTIIMTCTLAVVALLGFIAVSIMIRRRIHWKRAGYEQLPDETPSAAFISFSPPMADEVKALKEMTQDRLILIASAWDFLAGDSISNNLSEVLAETKKFIVVITPDYFNEEGTSKEFNLMQNAGLLKREKVLLIFTSANVVGNHLPGVLQEMYNVGEFFIWPSGLCSGIEFKEMARKIIEKVQE